MHLFYSFTLNSNCTEKGKNNFHVSEVTGNSICFGDKDLSDKWKYLSKSKEIVVEKAERKLNK